MMDERRDAPRLRTRINSRWETLQTQGRALTCDVSVAGCFVLSGGDVSPNELVKLDLILQDQVCTVWGYVVYLIPEMGFALRFVESQVEAQPFFKSIPSS